MKRNRRLAGLWNRKGGGYALAGICLLLLAGVMLALGTGNRAEAANVTLNGRTLSLDTDSDGAYLIKTADDLKALGMAQESETSGKTFKLAGDLTVDSITDAATGTFAGTFDGNGYIITIEKLAITTGKDETQASEGVLFGTVTGKVENLVVNITDKSASYTRASDAGTEVASTDEGEPTEAKPELSLTAGQIVSEASTDTDLDAYNKISGYDSLDEYGTETNGTAAYKRYTSNSEQTTVTTYTANEAADNSFGIICGTLGKNGTISQVSVNGESISVSQSVAANGHSTEETTTVSTPHYYYYKVGEGKKYTLGEDTNAGEVFLKAPEYYESSATDSKTASNAAVGALFTLQVSAPDGIVTENDGSYEITYNVTVEALTDTGKIKVSADNGSVSMTPVESEFSLRAGESKKITFTRSGTITSSSNNESVTTTFTAVNTDVSSGQSVSASSSVSTEVTRPSIGTGTGANKGVDAGALKIDVTGPGAVTVASGVTGAEWTYTVKVTRTDAINGSAVYLSYPDGSRPVSEDQTNTNWEQDDAQTRRIKITSWESDNTADISFQRSGSTGTTNDTFTVTGDTSPTDGFPVQTVSASAEAKVSVQAAGTGTSTLADTTWSGTSAAITENSLKMTVNTASAVGYGSSQPSSSAVLSYTVYVTVPAGSGATLTVVPASGMSGNGSWKPSSGGTETQGNTVNISSASSVQELTYTYTYTLSSPGSISSPAEMKFTISSTDTDGTVLNAETEMLSTTLVNQAPVAGAEAKNSEISAGLLTLTASAPAFATTDTSAADPETATIAYTLEITNSTGKEVKLFASESGTWSGGISGSESTPVTGTTVTVPASTNPAEVTYTRKVSLSSSQEIVGTFFQGIVTDTDKVVAAKTADVNTVVYGSQSSSSANTGNDSVVKAELKRDVDHVVDSGSVTYTLTLTNNGNTPVLITTDLEKWPEGDSTSVWYDDGYLSSGAAETERITGQIIEAGKVVELTQTINISDGNAAANAEMKLPITYKTITSTDITTYEYLGENYTLGQGVDLPPTGDPEDPTVTKTGASIYAGNHLYTGIFAGSSYGKMEEIRQDVDLNASAAAVPDTQAVTNDMEMAAGGVAGRAGASNMSDVYLKGNISSANNVVTGLAAAKADGAYPQISRVIAEAASGPVDLGAVTVDDGGYGADAKPDTGWTEWKTFSYYTSAEQKEESFDLGWLVIDGSDVFLLTDPANISENTVELSIAQAEGRELTYRSVYRARKQLEDQEGTSYYTEGKDGYLWDLGMSGYYDPVHAYATDGSYHYVEDYALTDGSYMRVYPYTGDAPVFTHGDDPWSIARADDGSLTDYIRLRLVSGLQGTVEIYDGATQEKVNIQSSTAEFEFTGNEIQVTAVPTLNGKIYEELESGVYTAADREPLPGPVVSSDMYYDESGNPIHMNFADGGIYEAGSAMNLSNTVDGCTYAFFMSAMGPDDGASITWEDSDSGKVTVDAEAFDTVYSVLWEECRVSFRIPEDLSGENYLYLKVSKENYPDTIFCFGSFTVDTPSGGSVRLYYDYDGSSGTEITDRQVAQGDVVLFDLDGSSALTELQYVISNVQLSGGDLYSASWTSWTGYHAADPVTIPASGGAAFCYVYTRMKGSDGGDDLYGAISEEIYTYADDSGSAEASPRTGTVAETGDVSGASVSSGTAVYLDASSEARILYLVNNSSSASISLERVSGSTAGLTEDGHYYKIGSRWYYTAQEGVKAYDDGSLVLYNETETAVTQYVHTLVLGEGLEPGACVSYIYSVQPTTQAAAPESTLPTRFYPGGSEAEIAQVEKDTYLSFTTLTPGAELYYVIGSGTVSDQEDPATGTRLYDSDTGILVDAGYGNQFVVSIKTVKWNSDHTRKEMKDSETVQFVFEVADQALAQAPTATPSTSSDAPTTVIPGDKILLSTTTRGASIYYTTDGSAPQVTQKDDGSWQVSGNSTMLYDAGTGIAMPEDGSGFYTIRAVAVHPDLGASPEAQFVYAYPDGVQSPYVNIPSGAVDEGTEIILRNRTEGADIYYTVAYDGGTPADPTISSALFEESQPIVVRGATVIKAFAVKDGVSSPVATFTYSTMDQLSAPEASIASGAMVSRGTRLTLSASGGASIYYTTDGSDPLDSSNTAVIAGDSLVLDGTPGSQITIRAYARKEGKSPSEVVTFTYQISQSVSGVTADVASGSLVSNGSKINLMTDVTDAEIYYTTDGSSPADYGIAGTVVTVDGAAGSTFTVKAVAVVDGEAGTVATFTYRIKEKPTAPNASPSGGVLTVAVRVELNSSADKIYYTTDGTTPTESSSLYAEPILINRTTELKAIAVSEDGETSEVAVFQYTAAAKAAAPTASQKDGALLEPGTVLVLSTETVDADIYYTTDGTEPDPDNLEDLQLFTEEGITINRTVTIKAAAYREDLQLSEVSEFNYTVETIPAVEMKRAEEERLAAEGLHDTDASALERTGEAETSTYGRRTLQEKTCGTEVSFGRESVPDGVVLVTEEKEYASEALNNVKKVFGDEYTILGSYDIRLMRGGTVVQPDGEVEIGVPVPEGYENAAVTLIYVDSGNKVSQLETRRSGGMIYGRTDHFSHYAVVGLEAPESADRTFPYLLILEGVAGIIAVLGTGYMVRQKWKKYKRDKNSR